MMFAYEPEAAVLLTLYIARNVLWNSPTLLLTGGGKVDIAAQKVTKQHGNIVIENLVPPHAYGDICGGFAVNNQFEN